MPKHRFVTRRGFLKKAAAATVAAPLVVSSKVFGANDKINLGVVGTGGRGRGDMNGAMGFQEIRVVAVCDVDSNHANTAKRSVDGRYGNSDCKTTADFREITRREDVDALLIGTPDHWHALISIDAMKHGKDVFCEKPETLTVRQGKLMRKTARRYGRVFSGGSQRVWGDYNWFHRMVRGGAIGEPKEAWVNVGWYRDYSGGNMTDWGCHGFGGALFALNLHETGPVEVHPPGGEYQRLTYIFKNGVRVYHGGGWGKPQLSFKGTEGEAPERNGHKARPPEVHIPNYKGRGGIFGDFVHCVRTREKPFRDIAIAHRTASHCHIGNIAYWLKRSLKWDPEREEFIGDDEANRWLDRPMRAPWSL
ncbi:MAG: Gfo/Idh/MocA family protein [Planctomycetota bacterium]|jgi:predicted dehydrogenase